MPTGVDLNNDPFLTHQSVNTTQLDPQRSKALQSRRQMGSATQLQRKYNRKQWASKLASSRHGPAWMFLTGAVLPFAMYMGLIALYTFDFVVPSFVWAIVGVLFMVFAYLAWPVPPAVDYEGNPTEPRSNWQWFPLGMLIISCVMGYIFGGTNYYVFMLPYLHYTYNREYTNVNPGENSAGFRDAGAVYFAANARVNLAQSVGFKDFYNRFCVAPIVSDNPSDTVGFFAAGLDCCDSRHDFSCWEAKDPMAHAGVRISETDPLGRNIPQFKKAAAMAASVYGFKSSEDPILLIWVKEPKKFADSAFWVSMVFLAVSAAVGVLGMCCCVTGLSKLRAM
jgi:hypothetical protein